MQMDNIGAKLLFTGVFTKPMEKKLQVVYY